jgi:hypothetical protein
MNEGLTINGDAIARWIESQFLKTDRLPTEQAEPPARSELEDHDIIDRLSRATPCVVCRKTCTDAAEEIVRLRAMSNVNNEQDSSRLMQLVNAAIFEMDPCGREDCISPSVDFMRAIRDELSRLAAVEVRAKSLAAVASRVWRGEAPVSSLVHSANAVRELTR